MKHTHVTLKKFVVKRQVAQKLFSKCIEDDQPILTPYPTVCLNTVSSWQLNSVKHLVIFIKIEHIHGHD